MVFVVVGPYVYFLFSNLFDSLFFVLNHVFLHHFFRGFSLYFLILFLFVPFYFFDVQGVLFQACRLLHCDKMGGYIVRGFLLGSWSVMVIGRIMHFVQGYGFMVSIG